MAVTLWKCFDLPLAEMLFLSVMRHRAQGPSHTDARLWTQHSTRMQWRSPPRAPWGVYIRSHLCWRARVTIKKNEGMEWWTFTGRCTNRQRAALPDLGWLMQSERPDTVQVQSSCINLQFSEPISINSFKASWHPHHPHMWHRLVEPSSKAHVCTWSALEKSQIQSQHRNRLKTPQIQLDCHSAGMTVVLFYITDQWLWNKGAMSHSRSVCVCVCVFKSLKIRSKAVLSACGRGFVWTDSV